METENNLVQDVKEEPIVESNEEKTHDAIPYSRFKELVNEKNTFKTELQTLKEQIAKKEEDAKVKELESKGEYDRIMAEMNQKLEKAESKATAWDDYQVGRKNSLLEMLPEDERAIYGELPLDKLEAHVDKVKQTNIPSVDNSKPVSTEGYKSVVDLAKDFQLGKINMDTYTRVKNAFRKN